MAQVPTVRNGQKRNVISITRTNGKNPPLRARPVLFGGIPAFYRQRGQASPSRNFRSECIELVQTPLVRCFPFEGHNQLFLKLEGAQITGSVKGRTAEYLLRVTNMHGTLLPGDVVVDSSSGNYGVALAELAPYHGYRAIIVVDSKCPAPIKGRIEAAGGMIVPIEPTGDNATFLQRRLDKVREICANNPRALWLDQYNNPGAQLAHFQTTGPELWNQMQNRLDVLIAAVSTGGTISGTARYLKRVYPEVKIIAVDVHGSAIFDDLRAPRLLNGIGAGIAPRNVDHSLIDKVELVTDAEAIEWCHKVLGETGLFFGGSGGAVLAACARITKQYRGLRIAALIADFGLSYANNIYNADWVQAHCSPLHEEE
jgi:cysteine synthase